MKACFGTLLAVFSAAAVMRAQSSTKPIVDNATRQMTTDPDTTFAMKAAQAGFAEVQMGKLATQKAADPDVKAFGQQMVNDHTKANDELKAAAAKIYLTLPADMDSQEQSEYNKLQRLSGSKFDREYIQDMIKDHEEDIKLFQKEIDKGQDTPIKDFASRTLPMLQAHLQQVRSIEMRIQGRPPGA